MKLFKRKLKSRTNSPVQGPRVVRIQNGANKAQGYILERKSKPETIYFRTKEDRDVAAQADQLAYDLRKEIAG